MEIQILLGNLALIKGSYFILFSKSVIVCIHEIEIIKLQSVEGIKQSSCKLFLAKLFNFTKEYFILYLTMKT